MKKLYLHKYILYKNDKSKINFLLFSCKSSTSKTVPWAPSPNFLTALYLSLKTPSNTWLLVSIFFGKYYYKFIKKDFWNVINISKQFTSRHFFIALSISSFFSLGQSALLKQSIRTYVLKLRNKILKLIANVMIIRNTHFRLFLSSELK